MSEREADMSAEAAALYQSLRNEGLELPDRDTLPAYRDSVRAGFEANVRAAVGAFVGASVGASVDSVVRPSPA